jgi:AcrR family transcriptional regulator
LTESFISTKDRIISTAIEIISDSGISQLTTKTVSLKANISEPLLYKFYGDMNELLVDVVDYYFKFDNTVEKTVRAKKGRYIDKIMTYVETYATYYDSYSELCTLMLQFEELLHNASTREKIVEGMNNRRDFLITLFDGAIDKGELNIPLTSRQLADSVMGYFLMDSFNRRITYNSWTYKKCICEFTKNLLGLSINNDKN